MSELVSIILAAGHGTRMRSTLPKVLHPVGHRPMLHHVMGTASSLGASRQVVVIGSQAPEVGAAARAYDPGARIAVQDPPQGTGDAVRAALPKLIGIDAVALILYADTPLVTEETLRQMVSVVESGVDLAVLGFMPPDPGAYGRLIVGSTGSLQRIVEAKDASTDELTVRLCNSGVMAVRTAALHRLIPHISNANAKQEYYLTDLVQLIVEEGGRAEACHGDVDEVMGVNDRVELAAAEAVFQARCRKGHMRNGVTMIDPSTVFLAVDTQIGQDVVIGPNVVMGPGVKVEDGAHVEAFSHLEGVTIRAGASVGPFARLRPGTDIGPGAKVGNFVEIKKSLLGAGAKVSHLTYLGDAEIGEEANIGAGTITCNYDGFGKFVTKIGNGAFVGSNSALVAPITIGDGAYVGSGSVITKDVPVNALAVARGRQTIIDGWAASFRLRREQETER